MSEPARVVIIGGGASGTLLAAHLLRTGIGRPLSIALLDRAAAFSRGLAYGAGAGDHLLNVPAGRMSAFPDDPDHFLRFAQERDSAVVAGTFLPRRTFGDYLEATLARAEAEAAPGASLERRPEEAKAVRPTGAGGRLRVELAGGGSLLGDRMVLALGNLPPTDRPPLARLEASVRWVEDPWSFLGDFPADGSTEPILLLGTGLTMIDVALGLRQRGHTGPLYAVSRRGQLPQAHRAAPSPVPAAADGRPPLAARLAEGPARVRAWLREVRAEVRAALATGGDWRPVLDGLRATTPALWRRLPAAERARFLRHLQPYWDTHRHRMAPRIGAEIEDLLAGGALTVLAGRVIDTHEEPGAVTVTVRARRGGARISLAVARIIDCTGPARDLARAEELLLADLTGRGQARFDTLGLGLDASPDGALLDRKGTPSRRLYALGTLLKGRDWESTAVPELRRQAAELAATLAASLAAEGQPEAPRRSPADAAAGGAAMKSSAAGGEAIGA